MTLGPYSHHLCLREKYHWGCPKGVWTIKTNIKSYSSTQRICNQPPEDRQSFTHITNKFTILHFRLLLIGSAVRTSNSMAYKTTAWDGRCFVLRKITAPTLQKSKFETSLNMPRIKRYFPMTNYEKFESNPIFCNTILMFSQLSICQSPIYWNTFIFVTAKVRVNAFYVVALARSPLFRFLLSTKFYIQYWVQPKNAIIHVPKNTHSPDPGYTTERDQKHKGPCASSEQSPTLTSRRYWFFASQSPPPVWNPSTRGV